MTETILITGANRGLGLEFVRQYASLGATILACCRDPNEATELQALQKQNSHVHIYALDVSVPENIQALANELSQPIDILINNAGRLEKDETLGKVSIDALMQTYIVNAVAPLKILEAFAPQLAKSQRKLVVNISSSMGSISQNTSGGYYSYRAAKSALNMLMKSAAIDLASHGIKVLMLHPGWVKTRMGGMEALITPEESITGMRKVIAGYSPLPGELLFYRYDGDQVTW